MPYSGLSEYGRLAPYHFDNPPVPSATSVKKIRDFVRSWTLRVVLVPHYHSSVRVWSKKIKRLRHRKTPYRYMVQFFYYSTINNIFRKL